MGLTTRILWLDEVDGAAMPEVGGKAARLASIRGAGAPVPAGFCVLASAYREFMLGNGIGGLVSALAHDLRSGLDDSSLRSRATRIRREIEAHDLDPSLAEQLSVALAALARGPGDLLAVRSSAVGEDTAEASFAGQLHTSLNVPPALVGPAIRRCWASLWTPRAIRYRQERGLDQLASAMAVLVQAMVPCDVSGIAFSVHPVTGADEVVVEATRGLGDALARGEVSPDRHVLRRPALAEVKTEHVSHGHRRDGSQAPSGARPVETPPASVRGPVATPAQLVRVAQLALDLERHFGEPQDVEWGIADDRLHVFQSRPITALSASSIFTDVFPDDGACWTSGFLEERFQEPLSPLGWSVIRPSFEEFALRDPLRYLGCDDFGDTPLTKLYRGHPYVNVEVFRRLYKLFPDWLLPEDAWRYFPEGDTRSRKRARLPRSVLDLRLWRSLLTSVAQDPASWSPFHNHLRWESFAQEYDGVVGEVEAELGRANAPTLEAALRLVAVVQGINDRLLRIHRWSLTHADLLYTLLRRLGRAWIGPDYAGICANLVSYLGDRSLEMDAELRCLVERARRSPEIAAALPEAESLEELRDRIGGSPEGADFLTGVQVFLRSYGHRSFSLDIVRPGFGADPKQLLKLVLSLLEEGGSPRNQQARREAAYRQAKRAVLASPLGSLRWAVFRQVVALAQIYVRLREDQRFHWQKGLATLRRLYLLVGQSLADRGVLAERDDVFFLRKEEIEEVARVGGPSALRRLAIARRIEYVRLRDEHRHSPQKSYPRFLRGRRPLCEAESKPRTGERLTGLPVSPGRNRGRAKIVRAPEELPELQPGDVLVTQGADPGWTPLFGKIGALVMESGGQLSHGSVVAREYGIPAVVGIANVTEVLREGDLVLVDGDDGSVVKLAGAG